MKTIKIMLAIAFSFYILNMPIFANCDTPNSNCTEWTTCFTPIYQNFNNCSYKIYYSYRTCTINNIVQHQVQLDKIEFVQGDSCQYENPDSLIKAAAKTITANIHCIFPLWSNPLDYKLFVPACIRVNALGITKSDCNLECCSQEYSLYLNSDGFITVTSQTTTAQPINCYGINGFTCRNICGDLDLPLNVPLRQTEVTPLTFCTSSCNGGPWILKQFVEIENGVTFCINYAYRTVTNCGNCSYELQVYNIQLFNAEPWLNYEYVRIGSLKPIVRFRNDVILNGFTLRYYFPKCWTHINETVLINGVYRIVPVQFYPCSPLNDCCHTDLYFSPSNISPHTITSESNEYIAPSNNCYNNLGCIYYCQDLLSTDLNANTYLPKIVFNNEPEQSKEITADKLLIKPIPSTGTIDFSYISDEEGKVQITIYDQLSNLILSTYYEKKSEDFHTTINLEKFTNGFYYYKVSINKKNFTGTLIIKK